MKYLKSLVFIFVLSIPILGMSQTSLSGNLVDIFHNPIQNSKITLVKKDTTKAIAKIKTDKVGHFDFDNIEPGQYYIEYLSCERESFRSELIEVKPTADMLNMASVMME